VGTEDQTLMDTNSFHRYKPIGLEVPMKNTNEVVAEEATGCAEHTKGFGQIYDNKGNPLTLEQAQDAFNDERAIEIPNAGAGSYVNVLKALGYTEVKVIEWSSSAGDWTFAARDDEWWYVVWQSNRYPRHGFSYSRSDLSFESFEEACAFAMM
jgi:polygalacturonase